MISDIRHETSSLPAFIILSKLGSGALNFYPKCSPCMVPGRHYWHTRSGCQRRPRPSSFVANSWRLQQCQPRPLSDYQQRWDRCHSLPNLKLGEVKLSLFCCQRLLTRNKTLPTNKAVSIVGKTGRAVDWEIHPFRWESELILCEMIFLTKL